MPELYHFSEEPGIACFEPRPSPPIPLPKPLVWAVDAEHAHLYLFPRDCPRVTYYYVGPETSAADRESFFEYSTASRVVAIESSWLPSMNSTRLYRYTMPDAGFECLDAVAGYWTSRAVVVPTSVEPVGNLLESLADAGVEVRIVPSLWPLYEGVIASTLQFSIIRWRNAAPRPTNVIE